MTKEQQPPLGGKVHLHLIEDDVDDVLLLKDLLTEELSGVEIQVHGNGREALDYFDSDAGKNQKVDMILLDINMPIMDGYEFLEVLRQIPRFKLVPTIVVMTADDDISTKRAYDAGANSVVTKGKLLKTVPRMVKLMIDMPLIF